MNHWRFRYLISVIELLIRRTLTEKNLPIVYKLGHLGSEVRGRIYAKPKQCPVPIELEIDDIRPPLTLGNGQEDFLTNYF